jgi:hypothetical protein
MSAIWRRAPRSPSGSPDNWIYHLRSSRAYIRFHEGLKRKVAPLFFALLFSYLGFGMHILRYSGRSGANLPRSR